MIKIGIVDDEEKALTLIEGYIRRFEKENKKEFEIKKYKSGIAFLNEYHADFDIIFMDIEMPLLNGMKIAKELRMFDDEVCLVFITNMAQYAVDGYSVNALDFMVKPVSYFDFSMKMNRALQKTESYTGNTVLIKVDDGLKRIRIKDIYYVEVRDHYLIYHMVKEDITILGKLKDAEGKLDKTFFAKCNHCYLVNLNYVTEILANTVVVGKEAIPMSRRKKKDFMNKLAALTGSGIQ